MINKKIQSAINESFVNIMTEVYAAGAFSLLVPVDDRWIKPLPLSKQKEQNMLVTISNWTYEESTVDHTGIRITTAFGKIENKAFFNWDEVLGVFSDKMEPIFIRTFANPEQEYNLKDLMY